MTGLLFLKSNDFKLIETSKGKVLCTNIPGFSLILFYSTQCKYCQNLIPLFKMLPKNIGGCNFGMINVSNNKECVIASRHSIDPINEVPYMLLYINGKPYMRYRGEYQIRDISEFVVTIAQQIKKEQDNSQNTNNNVTSDDNNKIPDDKQITKEESSDIPSYTVGKPLCGNDKVCYLTYDKAYNTNKNENET